MNAVIVPIVPPITLKRILYATDFSDASRAALPAVAALARRYGAEIYVANIRSPLPYALATPEAISLMDNKREQEARGEINRIFHSREVEGLSLKAIIETGDPAQELSRAVEEYDIDLAVVGTHGRRGLMRLLMGSLAEELFRNVSCPVLTVGPHLARRFLSPEGIKTILCPTDLSSGSQAIFPYVSSLAMEYRSKIVLLHVIPVQDVRSASAKEKAAKARREIQRMFCGDIDPRCAFEIVIDFGDPACRILSCARSRHADLIALGVRQAGEGSTHFRNTIGYRIALEAECPVLTRRQAMGS